MIIKKKLVSIVVLLTFTVLLTGCFDDGAAGIIPDGDDGGLEQVSHLKVEIGWEDIGEISNSYNQSSVSGLDSSNETVTRSDVEIAIVGTRILYPQYGGAWTQHVDRDTAEEVGIITYELPATDNAELHVVTVAHGEDDNYVLDYGVIENLNIPSGEILELTVDDIEWSEATWYPHEDFENFQDGLQKSDLIDELYFPVYLFNPFQVGEDVSREHQYIRVSGSSDQRSDEYKPGYRKADIYHDDFSYDIHFQPFFEGSTFFNLPESRYRVFPLVEEYEILSDNDEN